MGNTVVATTLIVGGTTALRVAYDSRVSDKPAAMFKIGVGVFALGAILALVSGVAPGLATAIAWLLIIATVMLNAPAIITATQRVFTV